MSVSLSTSSCAQEELAQGEKLLVECLEDSMRQLRPALPVSLLDLSPSADTCLAVAQAFRAAQRKVRIMTYEWHVPKIVERRQRTPEILVERGRLPGLHFSEGSFDYLVGIGVLAAAPRETCCRVLAEARRIAMRKVVLIEECNGAISAREIELRDMLLESGCHQGRIETRDGLLCLSL